MNQIIDTEIYDSQIRIYGLEETIQLSDNSILIIGENGIATEIIKNIISMNIKNIYIISADSKTNY